MDRDWIGLLVAVAICFAVAGSGAAFTARSVKTWYPGLLKPAGTPPSWVFGPVWSALYVLMATAAWLVWQHRAEESVGIALTLFATQLLLNGLWSYIFFGLRRPGAALVDIVLLWIAIFLTTARFADHSSVASWLMTPYLAWVTYASYLNYGLWRLNRSSATL